MSSRNTPKSVPAPAPRSITIDVAASPIINSGTESTPSLLAAPPVGGIDNNNKSNYGGVDQKQQLDDVPLSPLKNDLSMQELKIHHSTDDMTAAAASQNGGVIVPRPAQSLKYLRPGASGTLSLEGSSDHISRADSMQNFLNPKALHGISLMSENPLALQDSNAVSPSNNNNTSKVKFDLAGTPAADPSSPLGRSLGMSASASCANLLDGSSPANREMTVIVSGAKGATSTEMTSADAKKNSNTAATTTAKKEEQLDPRIHTMKWYVLVLTCLLLFGTDYCYDLPGAFGAGDGATIQSYFTENQQVYNQKMNQALYSVYGYPNMVMTIAGGLLIDKYLGLRKTTIFFSLVAVTASFIFAIGVSISSYPVMVGARFMLGCSGENLFVAQSSFVSKWFTGSNVMALAFGIAVSFSRLGGALAYILSPWTAENMGVPTSAFMGFGIGMMSFASTLILVYLDHHSEAKGIIKPQVGGGGHGSSSTEDEAEDSQTAHQPFLLSNIATLPKTLWFLALGSLLCYGATFPFIGIAKTYFERTYGMDGSTASFDTSLFHFLGAVLCPLVGLVVDRVGKGPMWLVIASAGLVVVFTVIGNFPAMFSGVMVMVLLSSCYSVFIAAVWSFAPFTVPESASGFAFGIMIAATNFGLATSPLFVGSILDAYTDDASSPGAALSDDADGDLLPSAEGFAYVLTYLTIVAGIAIVNAIMLWRVDARQGGLLMANPAERTKKKKVRDAALIAEWAAIAEAKEEQKQSSPV